MIEPLDEAQVHAHYDPATHITYITYGKLLSPDVTSSAYAWMGRSWVIGQALNLKLRGCIFDFRQVETFVPGNLTAAKTESKSLRQDKADQLAALPIALIAVSEHQRLMVGLSMKQSKRDTGTDNPYVRVVKTLEEAEAFIASFDEAT